MFFFFPEIFLFFFKSTFAIILLLDLCHRIPQSPFLLLPFLLLFLGFFCPEIFSYIHVCNSIATWLIHCIPQSFISSVASFLFLKDFISLYKKSSFPEIFLCFKYMQCSAGIPYSRFMMIFMMLVIWWGFEDSWLALPRPKHQMEIDSLLTVLRCISALHCISALFLYIALHQCNVVKCNLMQLST